MLHRVVNNFFCNRDMNIFKNFLKFEFEKKVVKHDKINYGWKLNPLVTALEKIKSSIFSAKLQHTLSF